MYVATGYSYTHIRDPIDYGYAIYMHLYIFHKHIGPIPRLITCQNTHYI